MKIWPLFLLSLMPFSLQASLSQDLSTFLNKLGGVGNVSSPHVMKDQAAGYYTGGNVFARMPVATSQLVGIQLPSYKAGCGGIDGFMGAFSHIGSTKLIEALKAIGSNMGSYALLLAIETMSPQVKNIITELNDLAQKINQSNINSCEIAATTLGGLWPKSDASQAHLCKMIGSDGKYGRFSDYAAARQGCGVEGKRSGVLKAGKTDPRFTSMLGEEFNLAHKALLENAFLRGDQKKIHLMMSLSGTLIIRMTSEGIPQVRTLPSLADRDEVIGVLLYGGEVELYRCEGGEEGCLNVGREKVRLAPEESLIALVRGTLLKIQAKIYEDQPLSEGEIAFLNTSRLPFYKILNVATAYRRGGSPIEVLDYAELAALDLLFQYLSNMLDLVQESVQHLALSQVDQAPLERFEKSLNTVRQRLIQRRMGSFKQIEQVLGIVRKTTLLERSLMMKAGHLMEGA